MWRVPNKMASVPTFNAILRWADTCSTNGWVNLLRKYLLINTTLLSTILGVGDTVGECPNMNPSARERVCTLISFSHMDTALWTFQSFFFIFWVRLLFYCLPVLLQNQNLKIQSRAPAGGSRDPWEWPGAQVRTCQHLRAAQSCHRSRI